MYKITKGQLLTIYVFGFLLWLIAIDNSDYSTFAALFVALIPGFLIFYTLGWKKIAVSENRNADLLLTQNRIAFLKSLITRKKILWAILLVCSVAIIFIALTHEETPEPSTVSYESGLNSFLPQAVTFGTGVTKSDDGKLSFEFVNGTNLGSRVDNDFGYSTWNPKISSGVFTKLVFQITSEESSAIPFTLKRIELVDQDARVYQADSVFHCGNLLREYGNPSDTYRSFSTMSLKPGVPCRFSALFERAVNLEEFNIRVVYNDY